MAMAARRRIRGTGVIQTREAVHVHRAPTVQEADIEAGGDHVAVRKASHVKRMLPICTDGGLYAGWYPWTR